MKTILIYPFILGFTCLGQSEIPKCILNKSAFHSAFDTLRMDALYQRIKELEPTRSGGKRAKKIQLGSSLKLPEFDSNDNLIRITVREKENKKWLELSKKGDLYEFVKINDRNKKAVFSRSSSKKVNSLRYRRYLRKLISILEDFIIDCS